MGLVGLDMENMQDPGISLWIMNLVSVVAQVYMLAWVLAKLDVASGHTRRRNCFPPHILFPPPSPHER
jgi:hypothetical protein